MVRLSVIIRSADLWRVSLVCYVHTYTGTCCLVRLVRFAYFILPVPMATVRGLYTSLNTRQQSAFDQVELNNTVYTSRMVSPQSRRLSRLFHIRARIAAYLQ